MLAIARSELVQIVRNRLVLVTSFIVPLATSALFIAKRDLFEPLGFAYIAVAVSFVVLVMGLYATTVTTLAARRQTLFLKRLASTAASDAGILSGLLLPAAVLSLVQVAAILAVLAAVTGAPAHPALVVLALVTTAAMMLGLGLATAGLTRSPEHAQVTTLPVILGTLVIASWVSITGTDDLTLLKRLLPGGVAAELLGGAWGGGADAGSLVLLAPTLAWVVVAVALAARLFRWEPRR
ncbi:ABC transporter permease [Actinokineospora bangkokensis]|uniref:ABC transporter permease n=1 Tax=Actinokineospora bangkokensis TaxID=1193682 RepID=A0A1Q9LNQ6_9PSEU|nr:ABC transporter permease [Actinokineospora bangkokensis]OLR93633.1 ABC transporter permease [Actinokineospora bangkokensis]